jgi:hypothetical protein
MYHLNLYHHLSYHVHKQQINTTSPSYMTLRENNIRPLFVLKSLNHRNTRMDIYDKSNTINHAFIALSPHLTDVTVLYLFFLGGLASPFYLF